jgi:hypothetical protein
VYIGTICLSLVLEASLFMVTSYFGFPRCQMGGHGRKEEGRYEERKISVVLQRLERHSRFGVFCFCSLLEEIQPNDLILTFVSKLHRNPFISLWSSQCDHVCSGTCIGKV